MAGLGLMTRDMRVASGTNDERVATMTSEEMGALRTNDDKVGAMSARGTSN